jgi:dimethylaniline monooxygenase (N-oxide forming)
MHSTYYTDNSISKGKKTIVVGAGKSGIDCAVAAYHEGDEPPLLLFRQFHWPIPRYLANILPFKWGSYSRFAHFMLEKYHSLGILKNTAHTLSRPLKWVWWRIVELMVRA